MSAVPSRPARPSCRRRTSPASLRGAGCVSTHPSASTAASPPGDTLGRPLGLRGSAGPTARCTLCWYRPRAVAGRRREAADESGSRAAPEAPRTPQRMRGARPALGRRARRPEPGHRPAGRGGRGQERAAGLPVRPGGRLARRQSRRRRVGDGAGLCRPAPAVRAHAGPPRPAARSAARRARDGVRPQRRRCAGPVPGRAGHADAVRRGRRAAAAGLHRRRRAVARPRLGADPGVRCPPPARRADRGRVRRADGDRR